MDLTRAADLRLTHGALLDRRVTFAQPAEGYRAAIDPVFLAAAVAAKPEDRVLELGCGAGAALLCLAQRCPGVRIAGVERDPALAALARENVAANGWRDRVTIETAALEHATIETQSFGQVMMNPPHLDAARHQSSAHEQKRAADMEDETALAQWIEVARRALKPGGALTLIHRADRLGDILTALSGDGLPGFGGVLIFPLWPKPSRAAKRLLVRAIKGSKQPLTLAPGLVLHGENGAFTSEADSVLRDGRFLDLTGSQGS